MLAALAVAVWLLGRGGSAEDRAPEAAPAALVVNDVPRQAPAERKTTRGTGARQQANATAAASAATRQAGPAGQATPTAGDLLVLARKLVADGSLREAAGLYRKVLEREPGSVEAHLELGLLCSDLGDFDCAHRELSRAHELQPQNADILEQMASVYRDTGRVRPAVEAYRKLLHVDPRHRAAGFELAKLLDAAGRLDEASVAYRGFVQRFPDGPDSDEARRRLDELTKPKSPPKTKGHEIPITRSGSAILVDGVVEDAPDVRFLLDTGSTLTIISRELAVELGFDLRDRNLRYVRLETANGPVEAPLVQLESVRLGRAVARNVQAAVFDIHTVDEIDGLLGLSFLDRFRVTIDAADRVMHLEPK